MTPSISKVVCKLVSIFVAVPVIVILQQGAGLLFDDGKFDSLTLLFQQAYHCDLTLENSSPLSYLIEEKDTKNMFL